MKRYETLKDQSIWTSVLFDICVTNETRPTKPNQIKSKTTKADEFGEKMSDLGENLKNLDISSSRKNGKRIF